MLTQAQNDLLTQTGPGTPCGKLLRSYWQPIAASEEMAPGADPLPIRIMSEDLVLFRDDKERLGLIGLHCAHRGTDLSYGRVEDGGLRCLYHGWLFDIHGKCIDQPAQPEGTKFCEQVRHTGYPVQEKGGCIWAYMGEGEAPLIPDFQFLTAPEPNRLTFRVLDTCNWLQGLEGFDPIHTTYLHRRAVGTRSIRSAGSDVRALRGIEPPELSIEHTSFGTRLYILHNSPSGRKYIRINNYIYPCGATPSTSTGEVGYQGRWFVPRDDHNHYSFEFFYRHSQPLDKEALRKFRADNVAEDNRHVRRAENRYLQNRDDLKEKDGNFCGIGDYFPAQDAFAVETQGAIRDRTKEHLGSTDIAATAMRSQLLKAIKRMEDGGEAPGQLRDPANAQYPDFICASGFMEENEDGSDYCRRMLAMQAAAE
jgi:phenylpropionate dioxygenase-like ring-hydroxylating dioxygenase large terminal subunit